MTKDEHISLIDQIRTATTDVERTNLLLKVTDDYSMTLAEHDDAISRCENLTKENAEYAKQNNQLWLRLSASPNQATSTNDDTEPSGHEPQLTYESLFK